MSVSCMLHVALRAACTKLEPMGLNLRRRKNGHRQTNGRRPKHGRTENWTRPKKWTRTNTWTHRKLGARQARPIFRRTDPVVAGHDPFCPALIQFFDASKIVLLPPDQFFDPFYDPVSVPISPSKKNVCVPKIGFSLEIEIRAYTTIGLGNWIVKLDRSLDRYLD